MTANAEIIAELRRVLNERDEALERVRLLEAEVERVTAREDATRRELSETRIDMRDAQRERDEARELYEDCLICNRNLFGIINDRTEARDEARAEVGRLREMAHDFEAMREDRDSAYRRGAEAMREACAQWVDHWVSGHVADKLRDMPTPEEP